MRIRVKIKKLHPSATIPTYATPEAAGADLYALDSATVPARGRAMIATGIAIELPPGYEAQCRSRSGLAARQGISVLNSPGTIDSDYRGELMTILQNHTDEDFIVLPGDRIAQIVFSEVPTADFIEVDQLSDSGRGVKGFGSTGVHRIEEREPALVH